MFEPFPKLTRFSQDWTVTEKIDGSNAQIFIGYIKDDYYIAAGAELGLALLFA